MNYKKLNKIKAGKAVYRHNGTLEQLQEVEMYCEGTDSPRLKGGASHYHMVEELGFCAISSPILLSGTTAYGSKDIFTEYHYFDEGAPVWAWNGNPKYKVPAYYQITDKTYKYPYRVTNKYRGGADYYQNIAPRIEDVPECSAEVPKQSDDTSKQPETKVKLVKKYTITLTEYEDGGMGLEWNCEGFSRFELIGVLKKVSELVERDFDAGKK